MSGCRTKTGFPPTLLRKVDPSRNMRRFYVVEVSASMFGDSALVRSWGRIGRVGSVRVDLFASPGEAEAARARLVAAKLKKGYRPVGAQPHSPSPMAAVVELRLPLFSYARESRSEDVFRRPGDGSTLSE